jgi:hypothetical protein
MTALPPSESLDLQVRGLFDVIRPHVERLSKAPQAPIEQVLTDLQQIVRDHHDAWLYEVFGEASGLPPGRLTDLSARGVLAPTGHAQTPAGHDPWLAAMMAGVRIAQEDDPAEIDAMRGWPIKRWDQEINKMRDGRQDVGVPASSAPPPTPPDTLPPPPEMPEEEPQLPIPAPPDWLTGTEREAWIQARTRGAEFCRGLGNRVDEDLRTTSVEVWEEDELLAVPEYEERMRMEEIIREETADAIARGESMQKLASRLGNRTGDWARNWDRIAHTELQGAHNEGVVIDAIRRSGDGVGIVRVPEPTACDDCQRVFLEGGRPRVFTAAELVENGTNVGRPRKSWAATIWPVHPWCRCDTMVVPKGFELGDDWRLQPIGG